MATVGVGNIPEAVSADSTQPNDSWSNQTEIALANNQKGYHSSCISWYNSQHYDSRGWLHDISLGTTGCSQWTDTGQRIEDIIGNYYEFYPQDYNDDGMVDQDTNGTRQGIYPDGRDDDLPEWIEITTDVAISLLGAPAGFIVAADDMAQALQPKDGFSAIKNDKGFEFLHTPGYYDNNWHDIAHFQRALYESGDTASNDDDLIIHSEVGRAGDYTTNLEFEMSFWKDYDPYVTKDAYSGSSTSSTTSLAGATEQQREDAVIVSTTNPREMTSTERRRFGIKKVDQSNPPTGIRTVDGEVPSFIGTNIPITILGKTWVEYNGRRDIQSVEVIGKSKPIK